MIFRLLSALAVATVAFTATPAFADVYALVEEDGTVRLSNVPDDPRYKLFMKEPRDAATPRPARNPGDARLRGRLAGQGTQDDVRAAAHLDGRPFQDHVATVAKTHRLDPALIHAVIAAESNYNPDAVSPKGAVGLMQVLPATGQRYGVRAAELKRPEINIRAGTQYLAELLRMFDGDLALALAGYNAGENAVIRHGNRVPPYPETQAYVPRVLRFYEQLRMR